MAKPTSIFNAPAFEFSNGILSIKHGGEVSLNEAGTDGHGGWNYRLGANTFTLTDADVNSINTVSIGGSTNLSLNVAAVNGEDLHITGAGNFNINGVAFSSATPTSQFETTAHIDLLDIGNAGTRTVNGDAGLYFAVMWDTLDDAYGALAGQGFANELFGYGGGYGSTAPLATPVLGETTAGAAASHIIGGFTDLAIAYVNYLAAGGDAVDYYLAKSNASGRAQTIHDNLLGSVNHTNMLERQFVPAGDIDGRVPGDWENRPYYDGNPGSDAADLAASVAFDVAHGVERDYAFG